MRWNCDVLLLLGLLMVSVAGVEESDMVDVTEAAAERVDQDYVDDSEEYVEELPEAEAWGRGKEMDDAVIVDQDRRLVAEQLIQELGEISSKLLDDNSVTIGTTHSISPTDLANVDTLLFNAGLTPRSKLVKNVFRKKDHVVHEDQGTRVPLLVPNMTKKNVEEIKAELQQMLFGTGLKQVRRQGQRRRPFQRFQPRRPQRRQRPSPFLKVPNAGQGPLAAPSALVPGRPLLVPFNGNGAPPPPRQPVNEFRPAASDFRLPESPFRAQVPDIGRPFNAPGPGRPQPPPPQFAQPPPPQFQAARPVELQRNPLAPPPTQQRIPFRQQQAPVNAPQQRPPGPVAPLRGNNPPLISSGDFSALGNFDPALYDPASAPSVPNAISPDCDLYAEGICLDVRNYPSELISNYLSRHKPALATMLAEVRSQSADDLVEGVSAAQESKYSFTHYYGNRRQGDNSHAHRDFAQEGGFLCPSDVRYARPQLAQSSRGVWKYIINMGEHTQTIRMERCLKPDSSCSYVSPHYKSHCIQVYNYHRLLSFEESRGMHVDIYKIPVGCNCHVQGYAFLYPPLDGSKSTSGILPPAIRTDTNNALQSRKTDDARDSFKSFIERQFEGQFNPGGGGGASGGGARGGGASAVGNRRSDGYRQTPLKATKKNDFKKTNYDYHPIIDFFNDRP